MPKRKPPLLRLSLAAAALACLWLAWAQNQQPAELTLQKVTDNLYVIMGSGGNAASITPHQHGDHTGGNAALLAAKAEILIHRNARANMAAAEMPGIPHITFTD